MSVSEREADCASIPVPHKQRRSPWTMGLLWITMVTGFPTVLAGFQWFREGITLTQVVLYSAASCLIVIAYCLPAIQLGTRSGLGYTTLSRNVFGRWGSNLVAVNLIWLFTAVYGLMALLLCESLRGLLNWHVPLALASAVMAMLMSVNNLFGFRGIANFARYAAAPMMIVWVAWTFFKVVGEYSPHALNAMPHQPFVTAFASVSGFVIGFSVWGNEPDYWRFGHPRMRNSVIPLIITLAVGNLLFPVTGWLVAQHSGITDYAQATLLVSSYAFHGMTFVSVLVLCACYFACNDSDLYGAVRACEHLKELSHRTWAFILALVGAATAALLSLLGAAKALEDLVWINGIVMPTPTVIMAVEWFLVSRVFKSGTLESLEVPSMAELPVVRYPAVAALVAGIAVGLLTSGMIPGAEGFKFGIFSVQAWLAAACVYLPLRLQEHRRHIAREQLVRVSAAREPLAAAGKQH